MIATEQKTIDGREFVRTYSDASFYILGEGGAKYAEAYDPAGSGRTYVESDEKIPVRENEAPELN